MKHVLRICQLMGIFVCGITIEARDFEPAHEDVWTTDSRKKLNKHRLEYFNKLLQEYRNRKMFQSRLVKLCITPKEEKKLLKKIKEKCKLKKTVLFYRVVGVTHIPVYAQRAHSEDAVRQEKCVKCMRGLYTVLRAIQNEEDEFQRQLQKIAKRAEQDALSYDQKDPDAD